MHAMHVKWPAADRSVHPQPPLRLAHTGTHYCGLGNQKGNSEMLATNIRSEDAPRQAGPSGLTIALASATSDPLPVALDPEFLQQLDKSNVLDRLKDLFQLARASDRSSDRAIRLPEVLNILGIGKSSWYQCLNARSRSYDPLAPQPFKLGSSERSPSLWWHSEIIAYLEFRAAASRKR